MSDTSSSDVAPANQTAPAAGGGPAGSLNLPGLPDLRTILNRPDLGLAFGVMIILVVLILPMPAPLLDFLLAISITFAVLVLMTALFIHQPLEFSSFPTILLIATMMRLSLNLASTRLILSEGHEGTHAAGRVIEAFGNFVMQGNYRDRHHRVRHSGDREFRRDHQRLRAHCRGRGALHAWMRCPANRWPIDADLSAGLINEDRGPRTPAQETGG